MKHHCHRDFTESAERETGAFATFAGVKRAGVSATSIHKRDRYDKKMVSPALGAGDGHRVGGTGCRAQVCVLHHRRRHGCERGECYRTLLWRAGRPARTGAAALLAIPPLGFREYRLGQQRHYRLGCGGHGSGLRSEDPEQDGGGRCRQCTGIEHSGEGSTAGGSCGYRDQQRNRRCHAGGLLCPPGEPQQPLRGGARPAGDGVRLLRRQPIQATVAPRQGVALRPVAQAGICAGYQCRRLPTQGPEGREDGAVSRAKHHLCHRPPARRHAAGRPHPLRRGFPVAQRAGLLPDDRGGSDRLGGAHARRGYRPARGERPGGVGTDCL